MIAFVRRNATVFAIGGSLALAAVSGYFVSQALGAAAQAPTETITITATGETGPAGPPGPPGPKGDPGAPGAESCPTGSTFKAVRIVSSGPPVEIWACVKN